MNRMKRQGGVYVTVPAVQHVALAARCCTVGFVLGANVRRKPHLRAVFDVMALVEAQVAQVVGRGSLVGFSGLRGQRKV